MNNKGYSLRSNKKSGEGAAHPIFFILKSSIFSIHCKPLAVYTVSHL